ESYESSLHQDFNGDGTIGPLATTIESYGSTSLVEVGVNYELNPVGGSNGPMLSYNGSPIHAGQFIWTPIGAEATASGYEIALETTLQGSLYYTVWNTDNNGNYVGNAIGAVAGNSATLESYESSLHQDLNGDGIIGLPTQDSASVYAVPS